MKFMKLGSKSDVLQAEGSCIRYLSSELDTDVIIGVGEMKFYLHKFPLISKSNKLQTLLSKHIDESCPHEIQLVNFPGGPKAFEICVKFCYGITVTLNPYNVVAARCAAEYLEMTEDIERGNLIFKIEVFLNSSILRCWKDSIIVLQTTKPLLPWSENLKIVGRCIDSIASKTSVDPLIITWSYSYNRKLAASEPVKVTSETKSPVPKDWWVEDICELDVDLYKRLMVTIKSKGRMDGILISEALSTYVMRWLPNSVDALVSSEENNKLLVETIICLLPCDKHSISCSCSFLLRLLKVAHLLGVHESLKEDLLRNISSRLDEASVNDLLIPARSPDTNTIYDVEIVQHLFDEFVKNAETSNTSLKCVDWLKVGQIVDCYLMEISRDPKLSVSSFIQLGRSIPESSRGTHDGLYGAIDIYLKEHKSITKAEKKSLCGLIEVKKLTTEASMHAAQNEELPLRVVVQIIFFEQVKATACIHALNKLVPDLSMKTAENWAKNDPEIHKSLRKQMDEMKIKEENVGLKIRSPSRRGGSKNSTSGSQLMPSRSRRFFDKLWSAGKGIGIGENNKSSETSTSSRSPSSMIQGEMKSVSRNRRHSIS